MKRAHIFHPTEFDSLTTGEVAEICQCSPQTIINWIQMGRLSATRFEGGPRRIPVREVLEFLKKNHAPIPEFLRAYDTAKVQAQVV